MASRLKKTIYKMHLNDLSWSSKLEDETKSTFSGFCTICILYKNNNKLGCFGNRKKFKKNCKTVQLFWGFWITPIWYNNSNNLGCFRNKISKTVQLFNRFLYNTNLYNNKLGCFSNKISKTVQLFFQVSTQHSPLSRPDSQIHWWAKRTSLSTKVSKTWTEKHSVLVQE